MSEAVIQRLLAAYETAEQNLLAIIARYALDGIEEENIETWTQQKYRDVKRLRLEIKQVVDSLEGMNDTAKEMLIQQYIAGGNQYVEGFIATNVDAVNALALDYARKLDSAKFQILRQSEDAYRRIIAQSVEQGVLGMDARLTTARTALAKFAGEGITGFVARDGRQYEIRSYVEMSTRTAINNAFREGRLTGLAESGNDLIIVRTSPRYCELCSPYKDKVLSISGKDTTHQSLVLAKAAGLYHANCRCSFSAYTKGLTHVESNETIDNNYEAEQKQRSLERDIRRYKRILVVDENNVRAKNKIKQRRAELKQLVEDYDLVRKSNRESLIQAR